MWMLNSRFVIDQKTEPRQGGLADVYRAIDIDQGGNPVAIKLFRQGKQPEKLLLEAFSRELQALQALKHQHVVDLIDFGIDEQTDRRFIVLEWLPAELLERIRRRPFAAWDNYYREIGRPVLDALVCAFEKRISHRDIKPQNILLCADGTPKVTDFNTAKFKGYLNPGVTMMEFVTRPYAPPETESPDQPETRDVFSYAVLAVRCFQKEEFVDYADVDASLEKCPLPERIATILRRALSRDPSERPANVLELLEAIDEGQASSPTSVTGIPIPIVLTKTAIAKLKAVFSENDETRVKARLNSDLSESPRVRLFITGNNADGLVFDNETIELFTLENYYKLALSADTRAGFVVTGAFTAEPSFIERRKSLAFSAHVRFVVANSIAESDSTSSAIDRLLADLVEHEARNKQAAADRAEEEVFRIWDSILRAKNKIEQRREQPLRYSDFKVLEGRITFLLKDAIPDDLIGQARLVKLPEGGSLKGEIEAIEGANVVLACEYDVRADEVPLRGELIIDTSLSRLAVQRQMEALTAVRFGRALRPDLRNMLCNPSSVRIPVPTIVDTWAQEDLDASKRNAVESALGSSDVLIVRGPPGTGKTKFISELVAQELRRSKVAKILLTVTDNPTAS